MSAVAKTLAERPSPAIPQLAVRVPPSAAQHAQAAQKVADVQLGMMVVCSALFAAACVVYGLYPALMTLVGP